MRKEASKLDPSVELPPIIFKFDISVMDAKYTSNVSTPEPVPDHKKPAESNNSAMKLPPKATLENKRLSCSLTGIDVTVSNESVYSNDSSETSTPTNSSTKVIPHIRCSSLQIEDLKIKHSDSDSGSSKHHHHHKKKNYPLSVQIQSSTSDMIVSTHEKSKNRNRSKSGRDVEVKTEPSHLKLQTNKNRVTRSVSNPNTIEEMNKKKSDDSPMTTSSNSDFLVDPLAGSISSDSPLIIDPLEDPS